MGASDCQGRRRKSAGEELRQVICFKPDEFCEVSYKDKKGRHQARGGIVLPLP